jgi:uncharacterized membrane protein
LTSRLEGGGTGTSLRRAYIDWARGLAVLIMIQAHVLDAWTLRSERTSTLFEYLNLFGGMAAPLFLWLAGLSLVLSAEQSRLRGLDQRAIAARLLRRGGQIFALAFLFRLQAFIVSPGNPLVSLLRVDILNIMGPSMVVAALLWHVAGSTRMAAAACAAGALVLAMATPVVRTASWLEVVPPPVQWYFSPNGNHSTFTLFPWAGFVLAGAAYGALLAVVDVARQGLALRRLGVAGLFLSVGSYVASLWPSIYRSASFWTTSPTYFGIRVGLLMMSLWALYGLTSISLRMPNGFGVVARLGRHSLFIYWIHVELVYGYATAVIHRQLPLWAAGVAYVAFCVAMYWSIALKEAVVRWWEAESKPSSAPETLGA